MSLIKKTDRMDIYLESHRQIILICQKWRYNWLNEIGTNSWTLLEKRNFHDEVDKIIWRTWGGHYKVKAIGNSNFANEYRNKIFTINFDIQWVIENSHWDVNVKKILPFSFSRSNIIWNRREINLDTEDIKKINRRGSNQIPVAHEFGHTIGNSVSALFSIGLPTRGDEYEHEFSTNRSFEYDHKSIMNIGMELRNRHLDYIKYQLETIYPNTRFQLMTI